MILSVAGYLLSFAEEKTNINNSPPPAQAGAGKEVERLQKENEALTAKAKELYINKQEYDSMKRDLASLNKAMDSMSKERTVLKQENEKWRSERASLYQEAGTAYLKAGLFNNAIDAYNKSLSYDPNNADVHYYLGLLYQKQKRKPEEAAAHFKRYLYLKPDAENKEEVRYLIEMVLNKR